MLTIIRKRRFTSRLICLVTASFFFLSIFSSDILALAPELRSKPFSESTRLEFQKVYEMMFTAGKLKGLIEKGDDRPGNMARLNNELKERFPDGEVEMATELRNGTLSTGKGYKYTVFHFKKENRSIEARFFKDDDNLTDKEREELGVKTDEDKRHFFDSQEHPALRGVWFVDPEKTASAFPGTQDATKAGVEDSAQAGDRPAGKNNIIVNIGKYKTASSPDILATYALGPCLGIALYDPVKKIGGLAHAMLPSSESGDYKIRESEFLMYVDYALRAMIKEMQEKGCKTGDLVAGIFGGSISSLTLAGSMNIQAAKGVLKEYGIPTAAEDVGGKYSRNVTFDLESGEIKVARIGSGNRGPADTFTLRGVALPLAPLKPGDPDRAAAPAAPAGKEKGGKSAKFALLLSVLLTNGIFAAESYAADQAYQFVTADRASLVQEGYDTKALDETFNGWLEKAVSENQWDKDVYEGLIRIYNDINGTNVSKLTIAQIGEIMANSDLREAYRDTWWRLQRQNAALITDIISANLGSGVKGHVLMADALKTKEAECFAHCRLFEAIAKRCGLDAGTLVCTTKDAKRADDHAVNIVHFDDGNFAIIDVTFSGRELRFVWHSRDEKFKSQLMPFFKDLTVVDEDGKKRRITVEELADNPTRNYRGLSEETINQTAEFLVKSEEELKKRAKELGELNIRIQETGHGVLMAGVKTVIGTLLMLFGIYPLMRWIEHKVDAARILQSSGDTIKLDEMGNLFVDALNAVIPSSPFIVRLFGSGVYTAENDALNWAAMTDLDTIVYLPDNANIGAVLDALMEKVETLAAVRGWTILKSEYSKDSGNKHLYLEVDGIKHDIQLSALTLNSMVLPAPTLRDVEDNYIPFDRYYPNAGGRHYLEAGMKAIGRDGLIKRLLLLCRFYQRRSMDKTLRTPTSIKAFLDLAALGYYTGNETLRIAAIEEYFRQLGADSASIRKGYKALMDRFAATFEDLESTIKKRVDEISGDATIPGKADSGAADSGEKNRDGSRADLKPKEKGDSHQKGQASPAQPAAAPAPSIEEGVPSGSVPGIPGIAGQDRTIASGMFMPWYIRYRLRMIHHDFAVSLVVAAQKFESFLARKTDLRQEDFNSIKVLADEARRLFDALDALYKTVKNGGVFNEENIKVITDEIAGVSSLAKVFKQTVLSAGNNISQETKRVIDYNEVMKWPLKVADELADLEQAINAAPAPKEVDLRALIPHLDQGSQAIKRLFDLSEDAQLGHIPSYYPITITYCLKTLMQNAGMHGFIKDGRFLQGEKIVRFSAEVEGGSAVIKVGDNGKGMPAEGLEIVDQESGKQRAFLDSFTTSPQNEIGSHGEGLEIVWEIVRAHRGTIRVDSEPGKGTTFTIRLPLKRSEGEKGDRLQPSKTQNTSFGSSVSGLLSVVPRVLRFRKNYHKGLENIEEYPDPAGLAKIMKGMEFRDGRYQGRVLEPGAYNLFHLIDPETQLAQEAHAAFQEFLDGLKAVFGPDADKIQFWETDKSNLHLGLMVFQEHKQLQEKPKEPLTEVDKFKVKKLLFEEVSNRGLKAFPVFRAGYSATADGGFVMLLHDPTGQLSGFRETLFQKASDLTGGKTGGRPKRGHVTIGRILSLPYSGDPAIRDEQQKKVMAYLRSTAKKSEKEWKRNLTDPSQALQYRIDNISLVHETQWLSVSGDESVNYHLNPPRSESRAMAAEAAKLRAEAEDSGDVSKGDTQASGVSPNDTSPQAEPSAAQSRIGRLLGEKNRDGSRADPKPVPQPIPQVSPDSQIANEKPGAGVGLQPEPSPKTQRDTPQGLASAIEDLQMRKYADTKSPERIVLRSGDTVKTFVVRGSFHLTDDTALNLAVDEESGKIYVVRKLLTEDDEDHCSYVPDIMQKLKGYEGVYQAQWMVKGDDSKGWSGKDDSINGAIVYPYIPGKDLTHIFSEYKKLPLKEYSGKLLDIVIQVADICAYIEAKGIPDVWSIKPENIMITPGGRPVLIDYTRKAIRPLPSIEFLLYYCIDGIDVKGIDGVLPALKFVSDPALNREIIDHLAAIHQKIKANRYDNIGQLSEELKEVKALMQAGIGLKSATPQPPVETPQAAENPAAADRVAPNGPSPDTRGSSEADSGKKLEKYKAAMDALAAGDKEAFSRLKKELIDLHKRQSGTDTNLSNLAQPAGKSAIPDTGMDFAAVQAEADRIYQESLRLTPSIPEKTIICHIVTDSILPDLQLKDGVLNRLESKMRSPKFGEKIVALSVKNPDDTQEFMAKLSELKRQIETEYQGYKVQFDVACPRQELVEKIQQLGMQALAFRREGDGDIVQVQGIILALRALRTHSIASLLSAHKTITGKDYTTDRTDINELARMMLFILPVRKLDVNRIGTINRLIEENIKSAA